MPVSFDSFHAALRDVYLEVIAQSIADSLNSGLWQSSELHWLGFTHEQDKFYVSDSFGRLKKSAGESSQPFDYIESYKINGEHFPEQKVERLHDAFDDLLNPGLEIDTDEIDPDELEDTKSEIRTLAALVSLALLAKEIEVNAAMLPVARHAAFHINVSADIEAPLWPAKPPLLFCDDAVLAAVLNALTPHEATRAMFCKIIAEGGRKKPLTLQQAIAG